MKKVIALLLALTMVFALCACGASSTTAQTATSGAVSGNYDKVNLKLSCNGTDTANDTTTAKLFADLVSKKSGGAVTITVYNNDQLASGDMQKGLELVLDGTVDMDCHSTSIISSLDNSLMTFLAFGDEPTLQQAADITKRGGIMQQHALMLDGVGFPYRVHQQHELTFAAYNMYRYDDFEAILAALSEGRMKLDGFVTQRYPIEKFHEALEMADKRPVPVVKVMLEY